MRGLVSPGSYTTFTPCDKTTCVSAFQDDPNRKWIEDSDSLDLNRLTVCFARPTDYKPNTLNPSSEFQKPLRWRMKRRKKKQQEEIESLSLNAPRIPLSLFVRED